MLGKYSKTIKNKYLETMPVFNSQELVMLLKKGTKIIVNQIMQVWETPYMKSLAHIATANGGDVLEVGYGMGISTGFIQKSKKIKTHTIIECHSVMIANCKKKYAKNIHRGRLVLKEGFWEDIVKRMPSKSFDGILFDSCPLDKEIEPFQFFPFFKEAFRLLKDNGVFTYFSDEPLRISRVHRDALIKAGFENITFKTCKVSPPKDCIYWKYNTIIAPLVKK